MDMIILQVINQIRQTRFKFVHGEEAFEMRQQQNE